MRKSITVLGMVALVATAGSLSFAGQPPGLAKKGKIPPGFSQGKKAGWQNEYPPGWNQRSEQEKQEWKETVQKGKKRVSKAAKKAGMSELEAESAADDFENAARKGLNAKESEILVKDKIKKGKKGKALSDSVAEESEMRLNEKDKNNKQKKKEKGRGKGKKK